MRLVTADGNIIKLWPVSVKLPEPPARARELESKVRAFFEIASAIELTAAEQRTLLDTTTRELALLRVTPANAFSLCGTKLERRVNYAIPILQRMVAAMAS